MREKRITIRVTEELHGRLVQGAKQLNLSLNSHLLAILGGDVGKVDSLEERVRALENEILVNQKGNK